MARPPKATVQLQNGVIVLEKYGVDVQSVYESQTQLDLDALLATANSEEHCVDADNKCYKSIDELAHAHGTVVAALSDAVQYMYAHLLSYPRLPSGDAGDLRIEFSSPFVKAPPYHYLKQFDQNYLGEFDQELVAQVIDIVDTVPMTTRTGIVAAAEYWEKEVFRAKEGYNPIDGTDDFDSSPLPPILGSLPGEAVRLEGAVHEGAIVNSYAFECIEKSFQNFSDVLGTHRLYYEILNMGDAGKNLSINLVNPLKTDTGELAQHIRLIPLGEHNNVTQMKDLACAHLGDNDSLVHCDNANAIVDVPYDPAKTCGSPLLGFDCSVFFIHFLNHAAFYAVEIGTAPIGEQPTWKTAGVINMRNTNLHPTNPKSGSLLIEGEAIEAARRVLSFDSEEMSESFCVHLTGFQGPCVDPRWVPAIDNELIDTTGNQYEESYRHYLNVARNAAEKARQQRELLMSDIIEQTHGEVLQEAQLKTAVDNYMSGVREICGDNVAWGFKDWALNAEQTNPIAFEKYLFDQLTEFGGAKGEFGCHPLVKSILGAPMTGPVHCAEKRRCSLDKNEARTLGDLGLFTGAEYDDDWFSSTIPDHIAIPAEFEFDYETGFMPLDKDPNDDDEAFPELDLDCSTYHPSAWEIMNPTELFDTPAFDPSDLDPSGDIADQQYQGIVSKFHDALCWAKEYKKLVRWFIASEPIYYLPELFDSPTGDDLIDVDVDGPDNYGHGRYYATLQEIEKTIEDTRSIGDTYMQTFDDIVSLVKIMYNTIRKTSMENDIRDMELTWQLTSLLFQKTLYNENMEQAARNCIENVKHEFNEGQKSEDSFYDAIYKLDRAFGKGSDYAGNRLYKFNQLTTKQAFIDHCQKVAPTTGNDILNMHGDEICRFIAKKYRRGPDVWLEEAFDASDNDKNWRVRYKNDLVNDYQELVLPLDDRCDIYVKNCEYYHDWSVYGHEYFMEYDKDLDAWNCPHDWWKKYENEIIDCLTTNRKSKVGFGCNRTTDYKNPSKDNDDWSILNGRDAVDFVDDFNKYFEYCYFRLFNLTSISHNVYNHINSLTLDSCARQAGCEYDESDNKIECNGISSESYDNHLAELEAHNEQMRQLLRELEFLNVSTQIEEFTQKLQNSATNIKQNRHSLVNLVRTLTQKIGTLSALEYEQVDLFNQLINNKLVSDASNVSNLVEWNERFDFRREEYEKQLNRARLAAWVARRAIEFRFGIDLSTETVPSLHGDIPADWANDIYDTTTVKCGEKPDEQTDDGSAITDCLAKEDRIEDYVQKLEDFVMGYGNSLSGEWWFHEDDDTAVISMRDHIAFNDTKPSKYRKNWLYFTEDMETEPEAMVDGADTIARLGEAPYYVFPQTWLTDEGLEVSSEDPDSPILGLPREVINAHFTNEWELFPDWEQNYTADFLKATPGQTVAISQVVDYEALSVGMPEVEQPVTDDPFPQNGDFSVYLRTAPQDAQCDEAAGEVYFPGPGRCGIPCDVNKVDETQPGPTTHWLDCLPGQVCMAAGLIGDENGHPYSTHMCNWCTADRACFGQDGQTVALEMVWPNKVVEAVKNSGSRQYAVDYCLNTYQSKVHVNSGWNRYHVNSDDLYLIDEQTAGCADVTEPLPAGGVSVKNTRTENLVMSSERIDEDKGWAIYGNPRRANIVGYTAAPDGSGNATVLERYLLGFAVETMDVSTKFDGYPNSLSFTGSVWVKILGDEPFPIRLDLYNRYGGADTTIAASRFHSVEPNQWTRVQITGRVEDRNLIDQIRLNVYSVTTSTSAQLAVWGAQIEEGAEATTYIPTGKNLIPNSRDLMMATGTVTRIEGPAEDPIETFTVIASDERSPVGTQDVLEFTDNVDSQAGYKYFDVPGDFSIGDKYTFSVWLKSKDDQEQVAQLSFQLFTENRKRKSSTKPSKQFVVDGTWRRFELTTELPDVYGYAPDWLRVVIYPICVWGEGCATATGTVLIWGPQLERTEHDVGTGSLPLATGYQETWRKNLINDSDNFDRWSPYSTSNTLASDPGPFNTGGVMEIRDDSEPLQAHTLTFVYKDWKIGDKVHFSAYVKNTDGLTDYIDWKLSERTATEDFNYSDNPTCPLSSDWTLCEFTHTIQGDGDIEPDRLLVAVWPHRYGDFGTVYVWGPQLEFGEVRTSYERTGGQVRLLADYTMESPLVNYWTAENGAILTKIDSNGFGARALRVEHGGGANQPYASQAILQAGEVYNVQGWGRSDGLFPPVCKNSDGTVIWTGNTTTDWKHFNETFTAAGATLHFGSEHDTTGGYVDFEDITVTAVNDSSYEVDSYKQDWGMNLAATGAQLTPVEQFDCDDQGQPISYLEDCEALATANASTCCELEKNWDPLLTFEESYNGCMACVASDQSSCGNDYFDECNPNVICAGQVAPGTEVFQCLTDPKSYNRNTYLLDHYEPGFEVEKTEGAHYYPLPNDLYAPRLSEKNRWAQFKRKFKKVARRQGADGNAQPEYQKTEFTINLDSIEGGTLGHFGLLSPNNFNYRLRTFAVNVVGTEVIDCDLADSPETCINNPWVVYDLKQMGDVRIRNHHKMVSTRAFDIPTGRISGGKAWAAEQVIGYPISGLHQGALGQLQKISLMGRPLQGTFELRVYLPPEVQWDNVEDIQLIMGYHYWTRSE